MKEQVVSSRGVRRSTAQTGRLAQRPARREGMGRAGLSPRALFAYAPSVLKLLLAGLILITLVVGYRAAASASLFQVRTIDVNGTARTSRDEIEGFTRRAVMRTGVWRADLTAISNELGRLPGVKRAIISRVLPDGLRVRIVERTPLAVVRTSAGQFIWVDEEGIALGEMKPEDRMPAFFIYGWNEDGTDDARQENIERVEKYQEAVRDWSAAGLADRVSEIILIDLHDIRAQLAGNDSQIEARLGSQDIGQRLKMELETLDMYRQKASGSSITYVGWQNGRVVIGSSAGSRVANETSSAQTDQQASDAGSRTNKPTPDARENKSQKAATNDGRENGAKKPATAKDKTPGGAALRFR